MMKIISEFREFASRGSVVDLAVGVIIGGAFGKIVDSLVSDLVMPLIGLVLGNLDFSNLFIVLGQLPPDTPHTLAAARAAGVPVFAYGNFITVLMNFLILAFVIFMMVKQINQLRRLTAGADEAGAAEDPPPVPEDVQLLREIRDCLKNPPAGTPPGD